MAEKTAKEAAVEMLARREHGVAELRRKLVAKGFGAAEAGAAVAGLQEKGLVDDARYAAARVRYRAGVSRWGAGKIRQELLAVGIGKEVVEAALREEGVDFAAAAKKALGVGRGALGKAEGRGPKATGEESRQERAARRQKALAKLLRRGFSYAEALAALEDAE
jgi:regulatory protein